MLSFAWRVMAKYKTLLMNMALEGPSNDKTKATFEFLCDVSILLGLVAILSLL